jgi:hypothetical protein
MALAEIDSAAIADAERIQGFLNTMTTPKEQVALDDHPDLFLRQMLSTSSEINQEAVKSAAKKPHYGSTCLSVKRMYKKDLA